jgi:hypothetical protein
MGVLPHRENPIVGAGAALHVSPVERRRVPAPSNAELELEHDQRYGVAWVSERHAGAAQGSPRKPLSALRTVVATPDGEIARY